MTTHPLSAAGPWGIALLSFDLFGFDAHAFDVDAQGSNIDESSPDDFRLVGMLGESIKVQLDYSQNDQMFEIAVLLPSPAAPEAIHLEALKLNYVLVPPHRIVFDPSSMRLEVRSELMFEGLAVEELAFELHYLVEVALALSGAVDGSGLPMDIISGSPIRG